MNSQVVKPVSSRVLVEELVNVSVAVDDATQGAQLSAPGASKLGPSQSTTDIRMSFGADSVGSLPLTSRLIQPTLVLFQVENVN